jgi:biotin transport system substrate-specific component
MADVATQAERAPRAIPLGQPVRRTIAVALFTLLMVIGAHISVPVPGSAVPVTMQTLFLALAGALLGPALGAASQVAYLALGLAGLPVFAGAGAGLGYLLGPTGGYLIAFPVAAWLIGWLAGPRRGSVVRLGLAMVVGTGVVLVAGAAQLAILTGQWHQAVVVGVRPFLVGELAKVLLATAIAWRLRPRTLGRL